MNPHLRPGRVRPKYRPGMGPITRLREAARLQMLARLMAETGYVQKGKGNA